MNKLSESTLLRWWESMFLSPSELKAKSRYPAPTVYKAQLKRCQNIDAAMLTGGFRALWQNLSESDAETVDEETIIKWAMIAMTVVHVKHNVTTTLATAAGTKTENDKPVVSELRFAQLQGAKTPDEFVTRLRRTLQLIDGKVSMLDLAKDIEQWVCECHQQRPRRANQRLSVQWALEYYKAAK
ncbi:type I-E CRISPR-associated protein Cse2/CasB [Xenorhabdus sp. XENO-1]|uniref:type I-E CRISPR-associated protein Cse2/CasB n=1 Tax=Xenorhabdus bovienii TaxID=40576 RepID=UPI0020CA3AAE|nr:type I-E CRISPR-associated protein Cse2/CasB [Xenorhabdus bovienii]MCP9268361.1 type I-E CRISPR-associated protein Cse2/CasB [Xenorhabdus bovienii subsp. africana]